MLEFPGNMPQAFPVIGQEGIDIGDGVDPPAQPRGDPGNHHAAIGMARQHETVDARFLNLLAHRVHMIGERNARVEFLLPRAKARQRCRNRPVARRFQPRRHFAPGVMSAPRAVDENVSRHRFPLSAQSKSPAKL